jgi:Domain of unknown function (DUF1963)
MNYQFTINDWLARFPLKEECGHYSAEIITSPCDLCQNVHLRREMQDQFDWGQAVPIDIFVMAEGEPKDRHVTKIGGLPYRPAATPWPTAPTGDPLVFLAQFNFADSKDLIPEVPGDVLLVFGDNADLPDTLSFEWQRCGISSLIQSDSVPGSSRLISPCHGYIHRTVSFPHALRQNNMKYPTCRGKEVWSWFHLLQLQATQIGEAPFFIQADDRSLPGRLLCAISSVQPDQHMPYPWINHPEPWMPEGEWNYETPFLMLGDVGCIYISLDEGGRLHWRVSCY